MYTESRETVLARGAVEPRFYVSTVNLLFFASRVKSHPDRAWETLVGFSNSDENPHFFEDFPEDITAFCPVYGSSHLLGADRDLQHDYAVNRLLEMGYVVVEDEKVDRPCDFTVKELKSLDSLRAKYLREEI